MRLFYSSWIREADRRTIEEIGIPSLVLMETAARGAVSAIMEEYPRERFPNCIIFIGRGNNGGDGLAVGRILHDKGYSIQLLLLYSPEEMHGDARVNLEIAQRIGLTPIQIGAAQQIADLLKGATLNETIVVDALFGTGLNGPLREGLVTETISLVNYSGLPIISLDIPSGLGETHLPGEGIHISAAITATFGGLKWALFHPDGHPDCGRIKLVEIGIPRFILENQPFLFSLISPEQFTSLLQPRRLDAHKGIYGHVLTIAGSREKPGAGLLSAFAALASGAGRVTAAVPEENRSLYVKTHPELMTIPINETNELGNSLLSCQAALLGPGLGVGPQTKVLVETALRSCGAPVVLDADALNVLELGTGPIKTIAPALILTPHPGEFARLSGASSEEIRRDRPGISRAFARKYGVYLVLKGHHTIVATPDGDLYVNQTGNPGMATAGSGDVLAGMIAGMIAPYHRTDEWEKALIASVFLHGLAGDISRTEKGERGMTASDILTAIPKVFMKLDEFHSRFQ